MLLNKGELDGVRLLGTRTVEYMTQNHLPDGKDLKSLLYGGRKSMYTTIGQAGVGFGLGFSVVINPAAAKDMASVGVYSWGGAASTNFWIDPQEDLIVIFMTQLMYADTIPLLPLLHSFVYSSIIDDKDSRRARL